MSIVVAIVVLVIASGLACLLVLGLARRLTAGETTRARASLEKLVDKDTVLLEGKLVVVGEECQREADLPSMVREGEKMAAITRALSRSRLRLREPDPLSSDRAKQLRLELSDGKQITLDGPVSVVLGSRILWFGTAMTYPTAKLFDMAMALRDGDRVVALGHRKRIVDGAGGVASEGYREASGGEVLAPPASFPNIRLAATARPRASMRLKNVWRHPLFMVIALLGAIGSIALARHYSTTENACAESCPRYGACHVGFRAQVNPKDALKVIKGDVFMCVANDDKDCRRSEFCRQLGWCTADGGLCKAAKDEDCAITNSCIDSGWCSAVNGSCKPKTDADCKKNQFCASLGYCSAINGECKVGKDADCAQTSSCASSSQIACTADLEKGRCVPSKRDCAASPDCVENGRCTPNDRSCEAASDEDCKSSIDCLVNGNCSASNGRCIAKSDDDCMRATDARYGRIKASQGRCVEERGKSCADSDSCRILGRCGREGMCEARSDRDCAQSMWCKEHGMCTRFGEECAASCATTLECRESGRCSAGPATEPGKQCQASTNENCRASLLCKRLGRCTAIDGVCKASADDCKSYRGCLEHGECSLNASGECKIARDEDCRQSKDCQISGRCVAGDGKCIAGKTEDCEKSIGCKDGGRCYARKGTCERASSDDCRAQAACKELGHCVAAAGSGTGCVAKSSEDCRNSALCKKYGWCDLVRVGYGNDDCFIARSQEHH